MSYELSVYFESSRVPSAREWTTALKASGFDIKISRVNLKRQHGFMFAWYDGRKSGFEFNLASVPGDLPEIVGKLNGRDAVACFRFLRDDEAAVAYPSALVLARQCDGVFYDPQTGDVFCDSNEIAEALVSYLSNYWLKQVPGIALQPGRQMPDKVEWDSAKKEIASWLADYQAAIKPLPTDIDTDMVIDAVPIMEIVTIPLERIHNIVEHGPNFGNIPVLGLAIHAIDRIVLKTPVGVRPSLMEIRDLCHRVLGRIGFCLIEIPPIQRKPGWLARIFQRVIPKS